MTENNYGNRDIKNQHLKILYKKYTDHIINFEKHIEKIYSDWVIDNNSRNIIFQKLDNMVRTMIKIYNTNLMKIYKEYGSSPESEYCSDEATNGVNYNSVQKNIYEVINMVECLENTRNVANDPFYDIKMELLLLAKDNGFICINNFLKFYINEHYPYLFNKGDL